MSSGLDGLADGRGGCFFLIGEPGIGKSRLAHEAAAQAQRRGITVLSGRASPMGRSVPYQCLTSALLHGLRSRFLAELSDLQPLRAGLAILLPGFVEGPAVEASAVLLGETVLRLAALLGEDEGALVVLEDLHWACGDSLAVTEYLADNAASEGVLVLGTARPEGEALAVINALARRGPASMMRLAPLNAQHVSEMAVSCLADVGTVPEGVFDVLHARAEGLPFLVEELLAGLVRRGSLVAEHPGWRLCADPHVDVPLSFSQSIVERLGDLTPGERRMVEMAAVLGREFDWSHLPRIVGAPEADVLGSLSRAVELQLVDEKGGDRFQFRHALTVEAILDGMLEPQRARLATGALKVLTEDPEPLASELLQLTAHLALQAGRPVDASRYLTEDARAALSAGAIATAVATARRARDILPNGEPDRVPASEVLLSALSQAGDSAAVDEVGRALMTELDAAPASADRRAAVRLLLAKAAHASLAFGGARQLCEEALGLDPPDQRLRLQLDLALAEVAFSEHQHAAAVAAAEAILADADTAGFADLACDALDLLASYHLLVTLQLRRAEQYLLASLQRAEQAALTAPVPAPRRCVARSSAAICRVRALHKLSYLDIARLSGSERIEQARALAEELGALALAAELAHVHAIHHLNHDELDAASACAEQALTQARRYRLEELAAVVAGIRATIEALRGNRAQAEREVAEAMAGSDFGPQINATVSGSALVLAALADDDLRAAAERVAQTRALLPSEQIVVQPLFIGLYYGVAAVVIAAAGARELIEGRDWLQIDDVFIHSSFNVAQAIVAGRAGDTDRAAELFAAGDGALTNTPLIRAIYRRYAAEAALADGWGEPARWLGEAESFFTSCGNEPLARACRSLLRVAGTSPRRKGPTTLEARPDGIELTTRESDVLALLADGLTNKQIAARLYLSPRTVEKHVERILAKTGQPNRTALAAYATEASTRV
ncbi:MAG: AAA family ATPase [Solirubrobacterales bacterium]|nr:AAA family ATPase [Solirubrobacterales bacterium]